ncbi:unnamed protein product [Adineta steineri]|uniref:Uncharacterized protein n=1 Tax=Adineta steineri TaxID=433720 RepID=A0A815N492_9BILA|nr:unnamed protein product [Adineta steineri]CAF1428253.1 unnamed protein product [Adineta steineri]CAF3768892.1 unnamed protein product [Adineta steineri]CAF4150427.1 unnamed protein product [Adineta steineri]
MASSTTTPIFPAIAQLCYGNACPRCGKCTDWYYDGNIKDDMERCERGESKDINDAKHWHRRPNGACRHSHPYYVRFDGNNGFYFWCFDHYGPYFTDKRPLCLCGC